VTKLACLLTRLLYSTHSLSVVALSHYFQATGKTRFLAWDRGYGARRLLHLLAGLQSYLRWS